MLSPSFLESMNGSLFWLAFLCAVIFARYAYRRWKANGYWDERTQAAIAIMTFICGDVFIRFYFWTLRLLINKEVGLASAIESQWFPVTGWVIQLIGALCIVRIFSPDSWGKKWLIVTLGGIAAVFVLGYQ